MTLTESEIRETIVGEQAEPRRQFLIRFAADLEPIIVGATSAHVELQKLGETCQDTDRVRRVYLFLHAGLNSIVSSTRLLVEGFPLASGNLMRHHAEACAMAMLLVDPQSRVLEELDRDPRHYPVHHSPHRISRKQQAQRLQQLLGFNPDGWRDFMRGNIDFYNNFSHAGAFSMAFHVTLSVPERLILGPHYDAAKATELEKEIEWRSHAVSGLRALILAAAGALPKRV